MVRAFWICLTKFDGGHLKGSLNLGGFPYSLQQCRPMIIRIAISRPALDGLLTASVWNAAAVGSRPIDVSPKESISPAFAHPILGPRNVFPNLGQAYPKEAR